MRRTFCEFGWEVAAVGFMIFGCGTEMAGITVSRGISLCWANDGGSAVYDELYSGEGIAFFKWPAVQVAVYFGKLFCSAGAGEYSGDDAAGAGDCGTAGDWLGNLSCGIR